MRMHTATGRSRWPYVIGGAVAVAAIAGGVAFGVTRPNDEPIAAPTTSPPASAAPTAAPTGGSSGAGDNEDDVPPTGCLGGPDRDADMVLAAQDEAQHTTYGAVEVATTFYRFLWQYPYPSTGEAARVQESIMAGSAPEAFADIAAGYQAVGDNPTQGVLPAGTDFHLSTTNGLWRVAETSTPDRVEVSLAAGYVVDGALSPTKVAVNGFVMVWEDDGWRIEQGLIIDQDRLAAGGTRYTGGC